jgi:hypothetical protein
LIDWWSQFATTSRNSTSQLTEEEYSNLKSQIMLSSWGGLRRAKLHVFTEQGVAMLSSILNSERTIKVMIERPVAENSF